SARNPFSLLRLVPLGLCANWLQPNHSAGQNFAPRLLDSHRVRLWRLVDSPPPSMQRCQSYARIVDNFFSNARPVFDQNKLEDLARSKTSCQCRCVRTLAAVAGAAFYGFRESFWLCPCGILIITSPGFANPNPSRAIFSILFGSVRNSCTSSASSAFSLFKRAMSFCTFSISCLVR